MIGEIEQGSGGDSKRERWNLHDRRTRTPTTLALEAREKRRCLRELFSGIKERGGV